MSSKDRIRQMADEAAAGEKEKVEKKNKTTTPRKKTAAATTNRRKIVWKVFDANYKEIACFPYPEKEKAYSTAEDLTIKKGKNHFVNNVNVPME